MTGRLGVVQLPAPGRVWEKPWRLTGAICPAGLVASGMTGRLGVVLLPAWPGVGEAVAVGGGDVRRGWWRAG